MGDIINLSILDMDNYYLIERLNSIRTDCLNKVARSETLAQAALFIGSAMQEIENLRGEIIEENINE